MNPPRASIRWGAEMWIGVGFGVLTLGEAIRKATYTADFRFGSFSWTILLNCLIVGWLMAVGASLHRQAPGVGLLLVWLAGVYQVLFGVDLLVAEAAVMVVSYGCGRWGSPPVLWLSGLSMPLAGIAGYVHAAAGIRAYGREYVDSLSVLWRSGFWDRIAIAGRAAEFTVIAIACALVLVVPWLLGIALRFRQRADVTEVARQEAVQDAAQAQQIAELKQQQADLARDVHDVVGHSLAVILAQAEAAQFRGDADHDSLQQSMRDIADAARGSLRDVRNVLSTSSDTAPQAIGSLDSLIDGVRTSGQEIVDRVIGTPRPLPPELDVAGYRVLQEMLTNAIKHSPREAPVSVTRDWTDGLCIEVSNETAPTTGAPGQGLAGMRRRVDAVGGTLTVQHEGDRFAVTARIPVRPS
jgi:signal transduction histidine kinase